MNGWMEEHRTLEGCDWSKTDEVIDAEIKWSSCAGHLLVENVLYPVSESLQ